MKKIILLTLTFLLTISFVSAITVECFDDGSIMLEGMEKKWRVSAKEKFSSEEYSPVPGRYFYNEKDEEYTFYSDEALFVSQEKAKYSLKFSRYSATASCPPFKFSCRIFNISVDYCYNRDGLFVSKFMVHNFYFDETNVLRFTQPFMLRYEAVTEDNKKLVHSPVQYSPEFKDINITLRELNAGNKYILEWPTNLKIRKFVLRYDQCRQKRYNFYKFAQCTEALACTINRDCLEDESCNNGLCEKLDCGDCQYIENHACFNYSCCANEDCQQNEQCENHTCKELTCAEDEYISEHSCLKLDCSFDEYIFGHSCVKLDCAEDEFAENHTCVKLQCSEDEFIFEHSCRKLDCEWYQKAAEHKCVGFWDYWWGKVFGF